MMIMLNAGTMERRSSLRRNSLAKREDVGGVKFPMLPHFGSDRIDGSSVAGGSSRKSSITVGGGSSRRGSMFRRGSMVPGAAEAGSNAKTEEEILRECVPADVGPRFSCELSPEGRYTVFRGYEALLRRAVEGRYPEYGRHYGTDIPIIKEAQPQKVVLNREGMERKLKEYHQDLEAVQHHHSSQEGQHRHRRGNKTQERDDGVSEFDTNSRLLMSRYLGYAHAMYDCLRGDDRSPDNGGVRSSKYADRLTQKKLDLVQGFEWWNRSWQDFYQVV